MGVSIKWNLLSIKRSVKIINKKLAKGINEALKYRKKYAEKISPVDTWEYKASHKIEFAKIIWNFIRGANLNDAEDATIVEYWARTKPVNRHVKQFAWQPYSQRPIIYRGVGANVYNRTTMETLKDINSIIQKNIWGNN